MKLQNFDKLAFWRIAIVTGIVMIMAVLTMPAQNIVFSTDGRTIYAVGGSNNNTIYSYNAGTGKRIKTMEGHSGAIESLELTNDGKVLISSDENGMSKLWDLSKNREITSLDEFPNAQEHNLMLVSTGDDSYQIKVWDMQRNKQVLNLEDCATGCFAPGGNVLVTGGTANDGSIKLWDITEGKMLFTDSKHTGAVNNIQFSNDGRFFVSSSDNEVIVWNMADRTPSFTIDNGADNVMFSPDGRYVVLTNNDASGSLMVYDISAQNMVYQATASNPASFSSDGRYLLAQAMDGNRGSLVVYDANNGFKEVMRFTDPGFNSVNSYQISPDGKKIATIYSSNNGNNGYFLYDMSNGKLISQLR